MVNKVELIGRLGNDAEFKEVGSTTLMTFSIATSERYKDKQGEWVENTEWHNCQMWRGSQAQANLLKKGTLLYVSGKIKTDKVEDKYYTKIDLREFKLLSGSDNSQPQQNNEAVEEMPF